MCDAPNWVREGSIWSPLRLELLPLEMIDAIFKLLPTTERNKLIRVNKQLRLELVGTSLFALPASSAPFRQDLDHFILFGQALQANDWETCWFSSSSLNRVARFELFSSCVPSRFVQLYRRRTLAGTVGATPGLGFYAGDFAGLNCPDSAYLCADGRVLIADSENHRLREVTPSGIISTIAGTTEQFCVKDGEKAETSPIRRPTSVTVDSHGRVLFVQESHRFIQHQLTVTRVARRIERDGRLSTLYRSDYPISITTSPIGRIFLMFGKSIIVLEEDGTTHNFIQKETTKAEQMLTPSSINIRQGIHAYSDGRLLIAEGTEIYLLDSQGTKTLVAGVPDKTKGSLDLPYGNEGVPATRTKLSCPCGVSQDHEGRIWFVDRDENGAYMIDEQGLIYLVAGTGTARVAQGPARQSALSHPSSIHIAADGRVVIADTMHHRVVALEGW